MLVASTTTCSPAIASFCSANMANSPPLCAKVVPCQSKMGPCSWEQPHLVSQHASGSPSAHTHHKLRTAVPRHDVLLVSCAPQGGKPWPVDTGWVACCGRRMQMSLKQDLTCALGPLSAQTRYVIHALPSTWMPCTTKHQDPQPRVQQLQVGAITANSHAWAAGPQHLQTSTVAPGVHEALVTSMHAGGVQKAFGELVDEASDA